MRAVSVDERRARLGHRHVLSRKLDCVEDIADSMVVLHASDPATVYLSVLARMHHPSIDAVTRALYDDRSVVRMLAMRRTLFVSPLELVTVLESSSTAEVAASERRRLETYLADSGIDDPRRWLAEAAAEIEQALDSEGAPAREITRLVPRLATRIVMGRGTKSEATSGATPRVLGQFAAEGLLVRGRPAGTWTGRQYRWHLRRDWLGDTGERPDREEASAELVRRWLTTFGPATFEDLRWWTGWRVRQARSALESLDIVEVAIEGGTGLMLEDDREVVHDPEPWASLLPALDPTPMGWKERDWYLGPHRAQLFDRSGNIGPTVWIDGRIVGAWAQRHDGTIVTRLLEDVGADHKSMIEAEAEKLEDAIGATVVRPSFPTPLQQQLSG